MHLSNESKPRQAFPAFGSDEHMMLIARRLERNVQFREQCEAWAKLSLAEHRATAAAILGLDAERAA